MILGKIIDDALSALLLTVYVSIFLYVYNLDAGPQTWPALIMLAIMSIDNLFENLSLTYFQVKSFIEKDNG